MPYHRILHERPQLRPGIIAMRDHAARGFAMVGAHLGNFALTLGRNKVLALAFGPAGVGWVALVNNLVDTIATVGGMGVCDALNRELSRRNPAHTQSQIVSSALAIVLVLATPLLPLAAIWYSRTVDPQDTGLQATTCFVVACIAASLWRAVSGIYLGLGLSRTMLRAILFSGAFNLVITAVLVISGVRSLMVYIVITPVLLACQGLWGVRHHLAELIRRIDMLENKAGRAVFAIALPVTCGLLLEPLTILILRSATTAQFGEVGVGLIQTGMTFAALGSAMFNAFNGMTLARWDQTGEPGFSPRFLLILAAALAIPTMGITIVFLMMPVWPLLVWLFFSRIFLAGAATVPWFLSGEALRMGGSVLNMTLLSRNLGYMTIPPRLAGLSTAVALTHSGTVRSIVDIGQIYACAYAASFAASIAIWLGAQCYFRVAPAHRQYPI